jgi:hypothetical protein
MNGSGEKTAAQHRPTEACDQDLDCPKPQTRMHFGWLVMEDHYKAF